jgi:hypothetical protein
VIPSRYGLVGIKNGSNRLTSVLGALCVGRRNEDVSQRDVPQPCRLYSLADDRLAHLDLMLVVKAC